MRNRSAQGGQSLAEFALVVPILLTLVLFALDMGRLFYAYVTIQDAARVAASYAGANPFATFGPHSEYEVRVLDQGLGSLGDFCPLQSPPVPVPTFADGNGVADTANKGLGDKASVTISCNFSLVTPVVGSILGDEIDLEARAVFPVRQGPTS
jgi:hypothetical protein